MGKGEQLVDERGRIHRALGRDESFEEAVRENVQQFGETSKQEKLVDEVRSATISVPGRRPANQCERSLSESSELAAITPCQRFYRK